MSEPNPLSLKLEAKVPDGQPITPEDLRIFDMDSGSVIADFMHLELRCAGEDFVTCSVGPLLKSVEIEGDGIIRHFSGEEERCRLRIATANPDKAEYTVGIYLDVRRLDTGKRIVWDSAHPPKFSFSSDKGVEFVVYEADLSDIPAADIAYMENN